MSEKFKQVLKKIWTWIIKPFLWIGGIVGMIFLAKKVFAELLKVDRGTETSWHKIDDHTISVYDQYSKEYVKRTLPIDKRTNKQVTADQIKAVGISAPGGNVHVEIKHICITDTVFNNASNGG